MNHWLLYGKSRVHVNLPDSVDVTVIQKPSMPVIDDPGSAVRESLERPADSETGSLTEIAKGCRSACIAICDITRPVPNHLFLRPTIETLLDAGISKDEITVLVATGLHRPNLGDELAELINDPWVLENIRIVNHDAKCDEDHVDLGVTPTRGTPVKIDRRLVEADCRIVTGLVEPHFMAGYSGGRKVIAPGLAHADTIRTFHNHAFMSNPASENCQLKSNPLHEEQLEILRIIGQVFAINTVIDENRNLSMVNFGEVVASHRQAVEFIEQYCRIEMDRDFPIVVTSSAGYPLDKTYYQTVKGMVAALQILRPGGHLVIASECSEGIGSKEFGESQQRLVDQGPVQFLAGIEGKPRAAIDEWQTQMQVKAMRNATVHLYSSMSTDQQSLTGVHCVPDLDQCLADLLEDSDDRAVAIIPEGPYVIPYTAR